MTPIKHILVVGLSILVVDHSDNAERHGVGVNDQKAQWLAWSLGRAHSVPVFVNVKGRLVDITKGGSVEYVVEQAKRNASSQPLLGASSDCEHEIVDAEGGGVKCTKCPGWFCW